MEPRSNDSTFQCSLQGEREIVVTRVYDAPRSVVFDAFADADMVRQWLYFDEGNTMPVCEMDVRPQGEYRFQWMNPFGKILANAHGTFPEVDPPKRFTMTLRYDEVLFPGDSLNVFEFTEEGNQTRVTMTMRYESQQARDIVWNSPVERNAINWNRLERMLVAAAAPV